MEWYEAKKGTSILAEDRAKVNVLLKQKALSDPITYATQNLSLTPSASQKFSCQMSFHSILLWSRQTMQSYHR